MRHWLTIGCCVAVLATAEFSEAQQRSILRGEVIDEEGKPVAGATVAIEDAATDRHYEAETGKNGEYVIMVPTGRYKITGTKDGYRGTQFDYQVRWSDGLEVPPVTIVSVQSIVEAETGAINSRFAEANALAEEGKLDEAQAAFEELAVERPAIAEVRYNLGLILVRKSDWESAAVALEKALELQPDHAYAALALAGVYEKSERAEDAIAVLEKAAAEHPDEVQVQLGAAFFHMNANRGEEARPFLEQVQRLQPEDAEVHYLLGTLATGRAEFGEAVALLERYLELAPVDGQYRAATETMLPELRKFAEQQGGGEPEPEL